MKVLCLFSQLHIYSCYVFSILSEQRCPYVLVRFSDDQENFMVPLKIPGFVAARTLGDYPRSGMKVRSQT